MPRKGFVERREVAADPVHGNPLVQKFVNCLMHQGEKSVAQKIVYQSLVLVRERAKDDSLKVFKKALDKLKPTMEVKSRRVCCAIYQVPSLVYRNLLYYMMLCLFIC